MRVRIVGRTFLQPSLLRIQNDLVLVFFFFSFFLLFLFSPSSYFFFSVRLIDWFLIIIFKIFGSLQRVFPLNIWILISNFKLAYNMLCRPDGTVNHDLALRRKKEGRKKIFRRKKLEAEARVQREERWKRHHQKIIRRKGQPN